MARQVGSVNRVTRLMRVNRPIRVITITRVMRVSKAIRLISVIRVSSVTLPPAATQVGSVRSRTE